MPVSVPEPAVTEPDARRISFGDVILDLSAGTLFRGGVAVQMRRKPFELLCHLARHSGRVLSKSELLDAVWPDTIVTEDSLTQAMRHIRTSIGDPDGRVLRTVHGRGYLLELSLEPASPRAAQPRVAVLPFLDLHGPAERRPMLDALTEAITAGLARFKLLTVLSRNSAFLAAADAGGEPLEAARRIGADYAVTGRAWPSPQGLRVTMELVSVPEGQLLWSDQYDLAEGEILGLRDLVPRRIVVRLFASLKLDGHERVRSHSPERLSAFENLARGLSYLRSYGPGVNEAARDHFARAIALDPTFGLARSFWAVAELAVHSYRLAPPEVHVRARAAAEEGLALAPEESTAWRVAAFVRGVTLDFAAAEMAARRAIWLNPCDPEAIRELANVAVWQGRPDECLEWLAKAEEIDPLYPDYHETTRSEALYYLGRYAESAESLLRLPRLSVRQFGRLAATYAMMGDKDAALEALARAETISPGFDFIRAAEITYGADAYGLPHILEGLRKALAWRKE